MPEIKKMKIFFIRTNKLFFPKQIVLADRQILPLKCLKVKVRKIRLRDRHISLADVTLMRVVEDRMP
jgi:hypothetical protein